MNISSVDSIQSLQEAPSKGSKGAAGNNGFQKLIGTILKAKESAGSSGGGKIKISYDNASAVKSFLEENSQTKENDLPALIADVLKSLNLVMNDKSAKDITKQSKSSSTAENSNEASKADSDIGTLVNMLNSVLQILASKLMASDKGTVDKQGMSTGNDGTSPGNVKTLADGISDVITKLKGQSIQQGNNANQAIAQQEISIQGDKVDNANQETAQQGISTQSDTAVNANQVTVQQGISTQGDTDVNANQVTAKQGISTQGDTRAAVSEAKPNNLPGEVKKDIDLILKVLSGQKDVKAESAATGKNSLEGYGNSNIASMESSPNISEAIKPALAKDTVNAEEKPAVKGASGTSNVKAQENQLLSDIASILQSTSKTSGQANINLKSYESDIEAVSENLLNSLKSLSEFIRTNVKSNNGTSNSSDMDMTQTIKSMISEIDLTRFLGSSGAGLKRENVKAAASLDDFKGKLVNLLVLLTKDASMEDKTGNVNNGIGIQNLKIDTIQKFVKQLSSDLKENNSVKSNDKAQITIPDKAKTPEIITPDKSDPKSLDLKPEADKENKILKSITEGEDSSNNKVNKVNTFITHLNTLNTENNVKGAQAAGQEKLVVNRGNINADIVKVVKYMDLNDIKELTVKVNPKEMGEIVIKLTMDSGEMKASITANSKETYNLLSSNSADLANTLSTGDLKIQNVDINIYQEDTTFFSDGSNRGNQNEGRKKNTKSNTIDEISGTADQKTDTLLPDNNLSILV